MRTRSLVPASTLLGALLVLTGCDTTATSQDPAVTVAEVIVRDFAFAPDTVTVEPGGGVTWVNQDDTAHPLVFEDGRRSELPAGATATLVFDEVGEFSYSCGIHASMTGTVTVIEPSGSAPAGRDLDAPSERHQGPSQPPADPY